MRKSVVWRGGERRGDERRGEGNGSPESLQTYKVAHSKLVLSCPCRLHAHTDAPMQVRIQKHSHGDVPVYRRRKGLVGVAPAKRTCPFISPLVFLPARRSNNVDFLLPHHQDILNLAR